MLAHAFDEMWRSGSGGKLGAAALASVIDWVEEKRWNRRRRLQK